MSMLRSMLRAFAYCTAKTRKSLHGLDYYTFHGGEAFDSLKSISEKLRAEDHTDDDISRRLLELMQYLRVDLHYKIFKSCRSLQFVFTE